MQHILDKPILIKKLYFQSQNRGCKELDILIGEFAKSHLESFSMMELVEYEQILQINDMCLYNFLTASGTNALTSVQKSGAVMQKILLFVTTRKFPQSLVEKSN